MSKKNARLHKSTSEQEAQTTLMNNSTKAKTLSRGAGRVVYIYWLRFDSGRGYVGSTVDVRKRMRQYRNKHDCNVKHQPAIYNAIKKHGMPIACILEITTERKRNIREGYWINRLGTVAPWGYNLKAVADVSPCSDETRAKQSEAICKSWAAKPPEQRHAHALRANAARWANNSNPNPNRNIRKHYYNDEKFRVDIRRNNKQAFSKAGIPTIEQARSIRDQAEAILDNGGGAVELQRLKSANTTPNRNITFGKRSNKWQVRIIRNCKIIFYTGAIPTLQEARSIRDQAEAILDNGGGAVELQRLSDANANPNRYISQRRDRRNKWRIYIARNGKTVYRKAGIPTIEQARKIRDQALARIDGKVMA